MADRQSPDWRGLLRRWVPPALTLAMLAGALLYFRQARLLEGIDLARIQWGAAAVLVALRVVIIGVLGLTTLSYTRHLAIRLDFSEWFGLQVAGTLVNILTPIAGGALVRGGYLKARHGLSLARYASFLAITVLLNYMVGGAFGLAVMAALMAARGVSVPWLPLTILGGVMGGSMLLLALPLERLPLPRLGRVLRWGGLALDGWQEIRGNSRLLAEQVGLTALLVILQALAVQAGLYSLGERPPLIDSLFLGTAMSVLRVTPTPGLGIQEFVGAGGASLIGINPASAFVAILLDRLAAYLWMFPLGALYTYLLTRRLGQPLASVGQGLSLVDEPPEEKGV